MDVSVTGFPQWLLVGLLLGGVFTVIVSAVFLVGRRVLPERRVGAGSGRDGGEHRRREEIRSYLRSIDEPFIEDHPIKGRSVAFFLPERAVAITFDAQHYFVVDRAGFHAILVEYELPGDQLGHRLPFDTPTIASPGTAVRSVQDTASAFAVLGLRPSATPAEVRAAYRERVKDAHPDHGGDAETFRRIREAYTVARDRAR